MLNQWMRVDPVELHRSATQRAAEVAAGVTAVQWGLPTPGAEWDVQALLDHLVGGTEHLPAAMEGRPAVSRMGAYAADYVGPAVDVGAHASPQARLLGAMGRTP